MKQILRILFILLAATTGLNCYAGDKDEITLTVTSDGPTKDDAIKNALRTAIEQAYGAFVSANTTILNDELVKDEIVTVSNGSIKDYKILSEYEKPDGSGYGVTANATVSLPHLITYAKNHGSECEFAGNTFGMDIKLINMQKENELKALYNMIPVVKELCKTSMHWEMEVGEPTFFHIYVIQDAHPPVGITMPGFSSKFTGYWKDVPLEAKTHILKIKENPSEWCAVPFKLLWLPNNVEYSIDDYINRDYSNPYIRGLDATRDFGVMKYIIDMLWKLSPDEETLESYKRKGINYGMFEIDGNGGIPLRNDSDLLKKWVTDLSDAIKSVKYNFVIVDNTGQHSEFCPSEVYESKDAIFHGTGVFSRFFMTGSVKKSSFGYWNTKYPYFLIDKKEIVVTDKMGSNKIVQEEGGGYQIIAIIPLSEIGKYSSFKIEPKE